MPRFRDGLFLRLWDSFPDPPTSRCSLSSQKVDAVHAICWSEYPCARALFSVGQCAGGRDGERDQEIEEDFRPEPDGKRLPKEHVRLVCDRQEKAYDSGNHAVPPEDRAAEYIADASVAGVCAAWPSRCWVLPHSLPGRFASIIWLASCPRSGATSEGFAVRASRICPGRAMKAPLHPAAIAPAMSQE